MTREEAIAYGKRVIDLGLNDETQAFCTLAISALSENKGEWIPVSERLPKVADTYAVTRNIGSDLIVDVCFFDGTNTWHNDNRINHERNYLTNIVAWMPLPEPYKAVSE